MRRTLDSILDITRELPPRDDDFVERVVERAGAERRSSRRRRTSGQAALAAVVLLIAGAALAAGLRVTPIPSPSPEAEAAKVRNPLEDPSPPDSVGHQRDESRLEQTNEQTPWPRTYRRDHLEWGYTSAHTSYVTDRSTGLRLETETFEIEVARGRPHRVSITLSNRGRRPITISAPRGCAMAVSTSFEEPSREEPAFDDPTASEDPGDRRSWQCTEGGDPDSEKTETFVLEPGKRYVTDTTVVFSKSGNWTVLSACRCAYATEDQSGSDGPVDPNNPARHPDPFEELGGSGVVLPVEPQPAPHDEQPLFTPPVRVRAVAPV